MEETIMLNKRTACFTHPVLLATVNLAQCVISKNKFRLLSKKHNFWKKQKYEIFIVSNIYG